MTREEQLKLCKICENRQMSLNQGLICSISGQAADFEDTCSYFKEDAKAKTEIEKRDTCKNDASIGKRVANYIIDRIFGYLTVFVIAATVGLVMGIVCPGSIESIPENSIFWYILSFMSFYLYFVVLEATTSRTLAKFITGTMVVTTDGEKPDFNTILLRSLCRFIPFEAFSFLGQSQNGWHDSLSKTRVIEVNRKRFKN